MLNVDTFKNLCMLAKTEKGKAIRKYYLKLETIYNQIIKKEIENNKKLLDETIERLRIFERKPLVYGYEARVYLIRDMSKTGHYKIGMAIDADKRIIGLNNASYLNQNR